MDPQSALANLLVELGRKDANRDYCQELLDALSVWIAKGGFLPRVGIVSQDGEVVRAVLRSQAKPDEVGERHIDETLSRETIGPSAS